MHFANILSNFVSILALSGTAVFAFSDSSSVPGRSLNLQSRDLNDLAEDLYARGWADRGLHERDLQNQEYERSLDFNNGEFSERGTELQERAPISYKYVSADGHTTVSFEIPTPIILAGVAFKIRQKALRTIRTEAGRTALADFISALARALHVRPERVGEGVVTAVENAASAVKRSDYQAGITERSVNYDY